MFDSKEIAKLALLRAEEIKVKKKRRNMWWKSAMLVGICAASVLIVITIFPVGSLPDDYIFTDDNQTPLAGFPLLLPDENAKPYMEIEAMSNPSFIISYYNSVTIPADTLNVKMLLLNPEGNICWFTFEIVLNDTEETLYMSGLVAPSMCIEDVTLSKKIDKGEHKALLIVRAFEPDSLAYMNSANINFDIIAE